MNACSAPRVWRDVTGYAVSDYTTQHPPECAFGSMSK